MRTFWLKIAALTVLVMVLFVLAKFFTSSESEPEQPQQQKTFYDVIEQDDKRLRAEPEQPEQPEAAAEPQAAKSLFRELSEAEKIEAEKLFEVALAHRKMGRLPGMGYKTMVDTCRRIMRQYPDSIYAFKAKRMLGDIPRQYWTRYKITEEEVDISN